jgi:hypothetical protein
MPSRIPRFARTVSLDVLMRIRLPRTRGGRIALALTVVYLAWGSSYLAVHVALESFPPLLLSGLRNVIAGIGLFFLATRRQFIWPTPTEIRNAGIVGTMLVGFSSGLLAFGMRSVGTGTAAVMVATVPLFATIISAIAGRPIAKGEWVAEGFGEGRSLLLDVRAAFLLDEDHAGRARLRRRAGRHRRGRPEKRDGGKSRRIRQRRRADLSEAMS